MIEVPGDVIKRAIDKVKNSAVEDYESVQFEGFGRRDRLLC